MDGFAIFLILLMGAIAYFLTIQGLFSALVMSIIVLLSMTVAFSVYEWLALGFLVGPLGDLALPVSLMVTFLVPLIGLRLLLDGLAPRSGLLPSLVDKICAAFFGLLSGYLMVGMLTLAVYMVPLGGSILGHNAIDAKSGKANTVWLNPDRAAAAFATKMSSGLTSGSASWKQLHPDLVEELLWSQSTPSHLVRHVAPPDSISVVRVELPDYIFKKTPGDRRRNEDPKYDRINPPTGKRWYLVRLALTSDAADSDESHRFSRRQVRLVGQPAPNGDFENYAPVAINDQDRPRMAVTIEDEMLYRPSDGTEVDFVFEVPEQFVPWFIEYKIGARASLVAHRPSQEFAPSGTPAAPPAATTSTPAPASPPRPNNDRVSGVRGRANDSRFGDQLPIPMTSYQAFGLDSNGDAIAAGHIYGNVADQSGGSDARLTRFSVPGDKRMFQLSVQHLQARSTLGRALNFAVQSVKNYQLRDTVGHIYVVVGQIAVADVDGTEVLEAQYFPEDVAAAGRGGLRPFQRIRDRHLNAPDTSLIYLFLVDPGVTLTEFRTSPTRRAVDLAPFNFVAPS